MITHNRRVVSTVGWLSLPEPSGSGFSCVFGLNHSDSAAHAKHYVLLSKKAPTTKIAVKNIDSSHVNVAIFIPTLLHVKP